jgi:hypothetical protein
MVLLTTGEVYIQLADIFLSMPSARRSGLAERMQLGFRESDSLTVSVETAVHLHIRIRCMVNAWAQIALRYRLETRSSPQDMFGHCHGRLAEVQTPAIAWTSEFVVRYQQHMLLHPS